MHTEEHLYAIALRRCKLIGDINFQKLVSAVGSAKKVWETPKKNLEKSFGIGLKIIREIGDINHLKFAENEIKFCEKNEIQVLLRHENDFPKLLNECEDAPAILYQKGFWNPGHLNVSIVGTRNMTAYGKKFVEDFFKDLPKTKLQSVSGLAIGVDTAVHEFSIQNKIPTMAVLAHGFHTLYPPKNKNLSEKILENGGTLITEFNSSQKPDRENFIQRNRIVAGISESTIVVETAFGGGSISTVNFANQYNRDVFALPGKITDKYSQGCNQIIFQNKARAISTISALYDELKLTQNNIKMAKLFPSEDTRPKLNSEQKNIYQIIENHPAISLDDIAEKIETPSHKILPILLDLELFGYIKSLSGRQYLSI